MTLRNKALGRTRQAFAATTLYIRGDVVSRNNALYSAKETFTSGATFDIADWDEVIPAPNLTLPTRANTAAVNSVGAGLPAKSGRMAGDIHFDSTTKKEYILTGSAGSFAADDFNRANAASLGSFTSNGTTYTWVNVDNSEIIDNQARRNNNGGYDARPYLVVTGADTAPLSVGITTYKGHQAGCDARGQYVAFLNGSNLTLGKGTTNLFGLGGWTQLATTALNSLFTALPAGTAVKVLMDIEGTTSVSLVASVTSVDGSVVYGTVSFTDVAPPSPLPRVGFNVNDGGTGSYRVDDFSFVNLGTLKWERTEVDATLASLGGSKDTVGSGLPAVTGRTAGDKHFDTAISRLYVLSNAIQPGISDSFENKVSNAALAGTQTEAGAKTWATSGAGVTTRPAVSDPVQVLNTSKGVFTDDGSSFGFSLGNGDQDISLSYECQTDSGGFYNGTLYLTLRTDSATQRFVGYGLEISTGNIVVRKDGGQVATASGMPWTVFSAAFSGGTYGTLRARFIAATKTLIVYYNGTEAYRYVDPGAVPAGAFFSVGSGSATTWDNFTAAAAAVDYWAPSEPIYLQAQLASGNVAVGTHVLKPGLRVPSLSNLAEIVLRCETAPVGAPITVQVERFNNGTSQGVIGTVSIPTGLTVGATTGLFAACAKGDILKFNVTSVGSTTAGADLTISLDLR